MSTTMTFGIDPKLSGWTLANTLRAISDANGNQVRIELDPQQNALYLADGEFTTTQTYSASPMGSWTVANGANATAIDENTTRKDCLFFQLNATSCDWNGANATGPFVYQNVTGNFEMYARVAYGDARTFHAAGIIAQDTTTATTFVRCTTLVNNTGFPGTIAVIFTINNAGSATNTIVSIDQTADTLVAGDYLFLRLDKSGNTWTGWYGRDGKTWTQIATGTLAVSSPCHLGITAANANTNNECVAICDWLRPWPPYDTTGPLASQIIDSGKNGTTWTMSTFQDYLNEYAEFAPYSQIGFGTLTYDYGASDTSPPSLSGTYRTTSQMQAQANPSGRYFKLSVKFTSVHGYDLVKFDGATIQGVTSFA